MLMESQVFEDEVLAGAESADHPPEEMPERQDHVKNIIGKVRINPGAKSFILLVYDVLARYRFSRHKLVQYSASRPPGLLRRRLGGDVVQRLRESSEATSMMGLGSRRMARTKAAISLGSNCVLAQRSSSLRASSAVRPFL